eukprot:m.114422 g.114422  ORF g.114422 m.114422 type:complete len:145 (+) comp9160_c0_seq4:371-805(+)
MAVDMEDVFGRSQGALCEIFLTMVKWLHRRIRRTRVLQWDHERLTPELLAVFCNSIQAKGCPPGFPVGAFVDGKAHGVCRPPEDQQEVFYSGHKRIHCFKYQFISTPDGMTVDMYGPEPGRHADGMFTESATACDPRSGLPIEL